jgi:phosphonate transport system substrate-binding protein
VNASFLRSLQVVVVTLVTLLYPIVAQAADGEGRLKPLILNVGFTRYAFSNVDRNDAEAAFKVFVQTIARKRGYDITSTTHVFEDATDFEPAILSGKINLVVIDTWRFLAMNIQAVVTPCFVTANRGNSGKRYVVLTRQGSRLDKLEDLRGKEILEIEVTNANLGRSWLETLLMSSGLGTQVTFFSQVQSVNKSSAAVLPVFFGQKPACLVDEAGFEVMKELNPQVGKMLQAVRTSELLADGMICLRNDGWPSEQQKRDIISALAELHSDPAGQQILTLFKISQLLPYEEAQLETVKQLRATHDQLRKEARP